MGLMLTLERTAGTQLFQQIADGIRAAIASGRMAPGARLPAIRTLAEQLSVARSTVETAYAVLMKEGAIVCGRGGTIVAGKAGIRAMPSAATPFMFAADMIRTVSLPIPLRPLLPALDAFPTALWGRLVAEAVRAAGPEALADPDPAGLPELRAAIASWLNMRRGIACSAGNVVVTAGFHGALTLVRSVLLSRGDAVWVEDPGHPPIRQSLEAAGLRAVPVRTDAEGLRVASGFSAAPRAKLAVVTPAHQYPSGVPLSLPRRLELLAWAAETGAWVLEDDSDAVFRLSGRAPHPLRSLDRTGRVLLAGSFSQLLFPALRLGYVVVPDELNDAFRRAARLLTRGLPALEQRALAAFFSKGHMPRHINRMRRLYEERRTALAAALWARFGASCVPALPPGGLHLIARLPDKADDTVLAKRAITAGLAPVALSSLAAAHTLGQGLLLAFSNIPADQAEDTVGKLKQAIDAT